MPRDRPPSDETPSTSSDERIRVLWLIKGLGAGGAERLLTLAARTRDRRAFEYHAAYVLPWKDALVHELEAEGVPVHCLLGGKEYDLRWASRLRSLLKSHRFDIVHMHSPYVAGIARLVVCTLRREQRPRLISTEHLPWSGYALPTRLLNGVTLPLDAVVVAVSESVRASIPSRLARRLIVEPNGINVHRIRGHRAGRAEQRRALGVGPEEILVGTVANLREQKDYPTLLAAARRVVDENAAVRFVAIGDGPLAGRLKELKDELGLGDRFRFLGRLEDPTLVLAACDVFVLSSLFEGLPLGLIEALALGLPAVATSVPGIADVVTDGREAILVPPGDPTAMAGAVLALAADPERRREMGLASLRHSGDFDISRMTAKIEDLYRHVAWSRPPLTTSSNIP